MAEETTGEALRRLAERAGLKGMRLAEACGWKTRSGPQPYLEGDRPLSLPIAKRFAEGLVGRGHPPIIPDEVWALAALPDAIRASDVSQWLPSPQSVNVLLERGLSVLPAGRVDPVDVEALSHALVAAMKYLARQPAMEHDEGYLAGAVSTLELAMQDRTVPRPPSANSKPDHKARNHANKQT